jgi:lipid-binding SYLF domain-containing protein
MKLYLTAMTGWMALAGAGHAFADTPAERLRETANVLREVMSAPDQSIPEELLQQSHCIVIVPNSKNGAFFVGGKYGRGYAVCRQERGVGWGPPAAMRMEGGSVGFQIGGSETDLVLLVMNQRGMDRLLEAAAGPVGRSSTAQTDARMTAQILSYSRSRGLFAGVSLQGATLRQDSDENKRLYGRTHSNKTILRGHVKIPAEASELVNILNRYSRTETAN